jgi:UPF0755 protein
MSADWQDPFDDGEAARERARRRAEREDRRRARRERWEAESEEQAVASVPPDATPAEGWAHESPVAHAEAEYVPRGPREPLAERIRRTAARTGLVYADPARRPLRATRRQILRRRLTVLAGLIVLVGAAAVGAVALVSHFHHASPPPAPAPVKAKTVDVTIAEGHTRQQIAALPFIKNSLKGNYLAESRSFKGFNPAKYGADHPPNLEGFLFPDTYELRRPPTAHALIKRQLADFADQMKHVDMSYARSKNLTPYDVLKIASMVEAEVEVPSERPLVAAVIYNRLHDGIPLGIDATIRYATGNYTKPLTASELAIDSPYNTRLNAGLPPTPIDNPGLASIQAAAHPAHVGYLYYVVKPCGNGRHFFTSSYSAFLAAQDRYNTARAQNGGKSPENC